MPSLRLFLRRTYGGLPLLTWVLCAAAFVNRAGAMVVPFLSLYLGQRFGYSIEDAGAVVALFGIGSVAGSLLGGRLSDAIGPVRLQILSLLLTMVWMWAMTAVASPALFAVTVLGLGVLNDAFRPGNVAAVAASCALFRQAKAMALNRLALNAGWAFGPALGGLLAKQDFQLLFLADGLTCGLAALVLWRFVPTDLGVTAHPPTAPTTTRRAVPSPLRDPRFLLLLALSTLSFVTFLQHFQTLSRHLERVLGYREDEIGLVLVVNPVLIVLLEMPLVRALRARPPLRLVAFGTALVGLGSLWLLLESWRTPAVLAAAVCVAFGEMLFMPFLASHVSESAPPAARGRHLGAYFATFSLGLVLAPWLGGLVYERCGAASLWLACCGCGLVTAAGFAFLHRTAPPRGRPQ